MTPATRVAVFTDNDFEKVNGVTTVLGAALAGAPPDVRVRVYTASRLGSPPMTTWRCRRGASVSRSTATC